MSESLNNVHEGTVVGHEDGERREKIEAADTRLAQKLEVAYFSSPK